MDKKYYEYDTSCNWCGCTTNTRTITEYDRWHERNETVFVCSTRCENEMRKDIRRLPSGG